MRIAIVQRPQDLNGRLWTANLHLWKKTYPARSQTAIQVRRAVHFLQYETGSKREHLGIDPSCCSKALLSSKTDWPVDLTMVRFQSSLVDGGIQSSAARCAKCSLFTALAVSNLGKVSNPCSRCVNLRACFPGGFPSALKARAALYYPAGAASGPGWIDLVRRCMP